MCPGGGRLVCTQESLPRMGDALLKGREGRGRSHGRSLCRALSAHGPHPGNLSSQGSLLWQRGSVADPSGPARSPGPSHPWPPSLSNPLPSLLRRRRSELALQNIVVLLQFPSLFQKRPAVVHFSELWVFSPLEKERIVLRSGVRTSQSSR